MMSDLFIIIFSVILIIWAILVVVTHVLQKRVLASMVKVRKQIKEATALMVKMELMAKSKGE